MKIRITKGNGWYEDKVGEEYEVIRTRKSRRGELEYVVWENEGGDNWVDESDCEEAPTNQ